MQALPRLLPSLWTGRGGVLTVSRVLDDEDSRAGKRNTVIREQHAEDARSGGRTHKPIGGDNDGILTIKTTINDQQQYNK